jgi:hypothetical protein
MALTSRFGWSLWLVALSWLIACGATVSSLIKDYAATTQPIFLPLRDQAPSTLCRHER